MAGRKTSKTVEASKRKTRKNPTKSPLLGGIDKINLKSMPVFKKDTTTENLFNQDPISESDMGEEDVPLEADLEPTMTEEELKKLSTGYVPGLDGPIDGQLEDLGNKENNESGDKGLEEKECAVISEDQEQVEKEDEEDYTPPESKTPKSGMKRKREELPVKDSSGKKAKISKLQSKKASDLKAKLTRDKIRKSMRGGVSKTRYTKEEKEKIKAAEKKRGEVSKDLKGWNCGMTEIELGAVSDYIALNPQKTSIDTTIFVDGFRQHAMMFGKQRESMLKKFSDRQATIIKDQEEQLRKLTKLVESLSNYASSVKKNSAETAFPERPKTVSARTAQMTTNKKDVPETSGVKNHEARSDFSLGKKKKETEPLTEEEDMEDKFVKYASSCLMDLDDLINYGGVDAVMEDIVKICDSMGSKWEKLESGSIQAGQIRQEIYRKLTDVRALKKGNQAQAKQAPKEAKPAKSPVPSAKKNQKSKKKEENKRSKKSSDAKRAKAKGKKKIIEVSESEDEEEDEPESSGSEDQEEASDHEDSDSVDVSGSEDEISGEEEESSSD